MFDKNVSRRILAGYLIALYAGQATKAYTMRNIRELARTAEAEGDDELAGISVACASELERGALPTVVFPELGLSVEPPDGGMEEPSAEMDGDPATNQAAAPADPDGSVAVALAAAERAEAAATKAEAARVAAQVAADMSESSLAGVQQIAAAMAPAEEPVTEEPVAEEPVAEEPVAEGGAGS